MRLFHFLLSGHATSPQHTCTCVRAPDADDDDDDDDLKHDAMEEYTCIEKVWFVHFTCSSTPAMGRQVQTEVFWGKGFSQMGKVDMLNMMYVMANTWLLLSMTFLQLDKPLKSILNKNRCFLLSKCTILTLLWTIHYSWKIWVRFLIS